jgi:general secretion pathway protein K
LKRAAQGFALAAVLWLLAGLSIVVSLVDDAARSSADRVQQLRDRTEFVRSALAARAQLLYYVALARPQSAGFAIGDATLLADTTPYRFDANSVVRLQDMGGLINLNRLDRPTIERLLTACGVASEQVPFLIDALEDYTDADDLQRINGAERDTYALAGKPPPRNAPLLSVDEVWQIHGWAAHQKRLTDSGCLRALTVQNTQNLLGGSINLATAPLLVLQAAGVDAASAADIISARADPEKVAERTALANAQLGTTGMFGLANSGTVQRELRVSHEHARMPWVIEYTLKLDFEFEDKPWSIAQPVIGARSYTPAVPPSRALAWPRLSALPSPSSNAIPVLPF